MRKALLIAVFAAGFAAAAEDTVRVWEQDEVIPTYLAGAPEPNPMFYFGRQSQGAEGRVYPYPLYDTLTNRKVDKTYRMVYLENEYVRIGILPEIGGRIFEGIDKTNGYNFFYRQHVIKPALIGLIGAWISGGVEWNIPHHHRATTFIPVQYSIESNDDGSKTVWVGELEVRHRMRWAVGYTLHPGRSYLTAKVRIVNRTPVANSMLCFANVAVHTNENYQVIFPPRTQYGTHHSKREFTTWPIATGRYGGWDFSKGVDVSWYKNHVSANSIFAWNYEDDFLAGYDHGRQAGTLSVADHHIVPGKKLWTWGNGPRGRMWDHILTDADGPYIELMVGAYSDNQPDYSWLQPYDEKAFDINWYPFRDIGGVKNATLDGAVNLEVQDGRAKLGLFTTSSQPSATARLTLAGRPLLEENIAIDPAKPFLRDVALPAGADPHDLRASLSVNGRELVAYSPVRLEKQPMPKPVTPYPKPGDIKTNDELYLTGLRIDQFHDPNLDPDPYWEEALRRDPGDVRVNTAFGINAYKRARYAEAERYLRKALERLTGRYTAPKSGEASYYLGMTLKAQGRNDEAFDSLFKATWDLAWRAAGYFSLAEIASLRRDLPRALELVDHSLESNGMNIRALNLKAALLRYLGRSEEARTVLDAAHRSDPLDVRSMAERWLLTRDAAAFVPVMQAHPQTAMETAAEYMNAGLWQDGGDVLSELPQAHPMVCYYLGYFAHKLGHEDEARQYWRRAASLPPEYVFPFQAEAADVLRAAIEANPKDARAPFYLGNLLYDWQPEEAARQWTASAALDPSFAIVHRNLAIARSHARSGNSLPQAIAHLEKAVSLEHKYPLHFFELDQLYEATGVAPEKRLAMLEKNRDVVAQRDDALARLIALKVVAGKYDEALRQLGARQFALWEGGTLDVAGLWADAHLLRGQRRFAAKEYAEALADFEAAGRIPGNLPSEHLGSGGRESEIAWWLGMAREAMGRPDEARAAWRKAAASAPQYYQVLALRKLGETEKAQAILRALADSGARALATARKPDSTASVEAQTAARAKLAAAHYTTALGYLGLNETTKAKSELKEALAASPDHLGARAALSGLQ